MESCEWAVRTHDEAWAILWGRSGKEVIGSPNGGNLLRGIRERVESLFEEISRTAIRVGRDPESIRLVAATKFVDPQRILEAVQAGVTVCGENRWQESQKKMDAIGDRPQLTWHFLGRIQTRKIKPMVGRFALIHSIESIEQAEELNRRAGETGVHQSLLLEVNTGEEAAKGGFSPDGLLQAIPVLDQLPNLGIQGLMTIPPWRDDPQAVRPFFALLRRLGARIADMSPARIRMGELSMGMSHDYKIAIEEGATFVRIGSGIFGERSAEVIGGVG